ncbi:hypothetical protein FRC02_004756 [Tulasnella sp. 418]|nr:hypothetical protein FRC02_004756 [Tulasnella sp. 418]
MRLAGGVSFELSASGEEPTEDLELPDSSALLSSNLQSLTIPTFSFPLEALCLSKLKKITFRAGMEENPLSIEQWHSFLTSSPELESITAYGGFDDALEELGKPFQVTLGHLKVFTVVDMPTSTTGLLLSSISSNMNSPPLVGIELSDGILVDTDSALKAMLLEAFISGLLSGMGRVTSICARYIHERLHVTAKINREVVLYLQAGINCTELAPTLWSMLIPLITPRNLKKIQLDGGYSLMTRAFHPRSNSTTH